MAAVISPTAGTRTEPMDSYIFVRGTTVTFKTTFMSDGKPVTVDTATNPIALFLAPIFLNNGSPVPQTIASVSGTLVSGQQYEYQFVWDVPLNQTPLDEYIVVYQGYLGNVSYTFGDEYFTIIDHAGQTSIRIPSYATPSDVRMMKFNIDDYMPQAVRNDPIGRDNILDFHLRNAATKLREELAMFKQRGNSENYRLFCIYHTVYSILLASRGEDGSSVLDQNLQFWKSEWQAVLAQEKRQGVAQGIGLGRG